MPQARRFIRFWLIGLVLSASLVALCNALVDPYLLFGSPRIRGFNERKPAVETQERMMKAYDVLRHAPRVLILGTSRVDMGIDTHRAPWPAAEQPAYNLGLAGGRPYASRRYLQHVMARRHLDLVLLGLDFEQFLSPGAGDRGHDGEFELRLATTPDGRSNWRRPLQIARDLFHGALSLDALSDSFATVYANLRGDSADLDSSGDLSEANFRREAAEVGYRSLFEERDVHNIRTYRGMEFDSRALDDVRGIIELCRSHDTRLIVFINPVHADMLELIDLLGYWPQFEQWKRELLSLTRAYGSSVAGTAVPLWDFSGYDAHSTESVPAARGGSLRWFWEPSHYTKALGDAIVRRIFGAGDADFGTLLEPGTLEAHLQAIRDQRRLYRQRHPQDAHRIRALYRSTLSTPPQVTASLR